MVRFDKKSSINFVILSALSLEICQVRFSELKKMPKTVPEVPIPNDFSLLGQFSAKGIPTRLQISTYLSANFFALSDQDGATTGTSSNCQKTKFFGTSVSVQTMFTIVSGIESNFAGADLLPKTVVTSKKYFPNHLNPKQFHCEGCPGIIL